MFPLEEDLILAEELGRGRGVMGGLDYNMSSGGFDVPLGGGLAYDPRDGDLAIEIFPGLDIDI